MTKTTRSYQGPGFCTKEFKDRTSRFWNDGDNHSMVLYQHGYCPSSIDFKLNENDMNGDWVIEKYFEMWQQGDTVIVEMNMQEQKGRIWNKEIPDNVLVVGLPNECTFLLMMGNTDQIITIKDIQIQRAK